MTVTTILGLCAIPCIAGIAAYYRYKKVRWLPFGTGYGIDSPDGRYRAHAADYVDESFWGRKTRFYGFEVTDRRTGQTLARNEMPRVLQQEQAPGVDFYSEVLVSWTPDSKRVQAEFRGQILWEYEVPNAEPDGRANGWPATPLGNS